ncbi:MAG: aminopeptidase [Erysipelotrichaceae bacterium]|jgi:aminopeptidase|nr:aminopeptidase [Erysipelotrichaceae bacterium]
MEKSRLKAYAKTIVRIGANVQKGQEVFITIGVEHEDFAFLLSKECYAAGAKKVFFNWTSQKLEKLMYQKEKLDSLMNVRSFQIERFKYMAQELPATIYILSDDPNGLDGIDHLKFGKARQSFSQAIKSYRDAMDDKQQWTIAALPTKKWAKKVFPHETTSEAMKKLGNLILDVSRIDDDPLLAWEKHNAFLKNQAQKLNQLGIDYLHYTNTLGTDFKVWLIPDSHFIAGSETIPGTKITYNPNMPSEECFITPLKGKAEGRVYATKPLSYNGQLIDDFYLDFKDGKVVDFKAKVGQNVLETMLNMDAGARMLGEVALVPYDSPISKSNVLFYETLFDENASCHLALGRGFAASFNDFDKYTLKELYEKGLNDSLIHVDFMMGSKDLKIVAYLKSGEKVLIFKDGNWAL